MSVNDPSYEDTLDLAKRWPDEWRNDSGGGIRHPDCTWCLYPSLTVTELDRLHGSATRLCDWHVRVLVDASYRFFPLWMRDEARTTAVDSLRRQREEERDLLAALYFGPDAVDPEHDSARATGGLAGGSAQTFMAAETSERVGDGEANHD